MSFWQYIFSFLYTRNWHTGVRELSRPRLLVFVSGVLLVLVALAMVIFLQNPIVYVSSAAG